VVTRHRFGFRVRDVEHVLFVYVQAARPAELRPCIEQLAALVVDLNPVVRAIAHEQSSARIHGEGVRLVHLGRPRSLAAERHDELPVARELQHARVRAAMSLRDEDVAVGRDQYIVRLVEEVGRRCAAGFTERHQELALGAELEDLMTACRSREWTGASRRRARRSLCRLWRRRRRRRIVLAIGDPEVAVTVDVDPVRKNEQPLAEARDQFSRCVKLQNRGQVRHLPGRPIEAAIGTASFSHPDASSVLIDLYRARGSPRSTVGHLEEVLDRRVWIGRRVCRGTRRWGLSADADEARADEADAEYGGCSIHTTLLGA
jgi:hypothetical protein